MYSKQTISSSYVAALKLACVCSLACVTARELGVEVVSLHSSTSDSEEDFLLDTWDDWMGSDSEGELSFYLLHVCIQDRSESAS